MDRKLKIISVDFVKTNSPKVKARADVHFDGFELKGFKIVQGEPGKEYVTPPSYLAKGKGWRELFRTDSKEDWEYIHQTILSKFNEFEMKESVDMTFEEEAL